MLCLSTDATCFMPGKACPPDPSISGSMYRLSPIAVVLGKEKQIVGDACYLTDLQWVMLEINCGTSYTSDLNEVTDS